MLSDTYSPLERRKQLVVVRTVSRKLDAGDYYLPDSSVLIERKGSFSEVHQNCLTHDRTRFLKALDRLRAAAPRPYLLLEVDFPFSDPEHPLAVDALLRETNARDISLLMLPTRTETQRRTAGEICVRTLLSGLPSCCYTPTTPAKPKELTHECVD